MKKLVSKIISSPVHITYVTLMVLLIFVQTIHTHAHHDMEWDVHGHCRKFIRRNPSFR